MSLAQDLHLLPFISSGMQDAVTVAIRDIQLRLYYNKFLSLSMIKKLHIL